jgi:hypothetical protein
VAGERKPRDRAILALLAYGGLRRGEVMAADVGDYSREAPSLMVHGKGNKDRVVPLHAVAQTALDAYLVTRRDLAPGHPLFVSWRGRITKQVVVLLCKRVSRRIGRRLHPHLLHLRHRAAEPPRGSARDPDAARAGVAGHHRDLHSREPGARAGGGGAAGGIAEWTLTVSVPRPSVLDMTVSPVSACRCLQADAIVALSQ